MSDLPSTSSLVNRSSASSSLSAKSLGKAATGTPPLLKDLSSNSVDTYFWDGLLASINSTAVGSITAAQRQGFWQGEGACRMAQAVGYAFQHILQGGTSMCYMQNAPKSSNGVTVTSGEGEVSKVFNQGTSNKVVKVNVTNFPGEESESETIFIKVYGSGSSEGTSGYAADLWFCSSSGSAKGYEQIRVNNTDKTVTVTSTHSDFGSFVGTISASLTSSGGQLVFDSSKERSATVYFGPKDGTFTFLGSVTINSSNLLTARDYSTGAFGGQSNTNKHAIFAEYTGDTLDTLRFSAASFALQDTFGGNPMTITDATEYSTSKYANVDSGTLLTTAQAERFDGDIYKGTSSTQYSNARSKLDAVSGFSCSTSADAVVSMDFSQSGPLAVASKCESHFASMNFCDGSSVQSARDKIFLSQANQGACSTSFCAVGDDFSCQMWADDHPGNSQGITTANAKCSNMGCCTTQ
ncbi:MAG: hypothetical protein HY543_05240 [Deltaproteobacteria bacterium]|nr:hypothetical protein [Deltaproteobacteria bacterium]